MQIDVMAMGGASITLDVAYYYFTVEQHGNVTHVNYATDDPTGPFNQHMGDFASFRGTMPGYLYIPVPHNATP
jgi:hypothetical protein